MMPTKPRPPNSVRFSTFAPITTCQRASDVRPAVQAFDDLIGKALDKTGVMAAAILKGAKTTEPHQPVVQPIARASAVFSGSGTGHEQVFDIALKRKIAGGVDRVDATVQALRLPHPDRNPP
ncbi:MAG: hypothetical protein H7245_19390 [Candidatus Saccharibacteria bacterium]|nr:hypothetical protein [Pseudorhodobacter sp.]